MVLFSQGLHIDKIHRIEFISIVTKSYAVCHARSYITKNAVDISAGIGRYPPHVSESKPLGYRIRTAK